MGFIEEKKITGVISDERYPQLKGDVRRYSKGTSD